MTKIWSELSQKDRMVARGIADVEGGKIKDIREHLHMETNEVITISEKTD